ncbi:MAG TPA: hypothetical protein IAA61_03625 [Candidatus Ornithomonoglobus merdipullorum]|uniref:Uncharacterized protein n=1 Tax=Candidatus Ornithomonoglobus merdipullorum TaxID=2840895 RepID=A0A9D1MB01_9FIRM|nr:hypothetical protein [Candidatus Ornithomonoglobus merdipullorum]
MKATKIFTAAVTAMLMASSAQAAEIPRESAPLNATEEQIVIAEKLICDILDEVAIGNMGYTEAAGMANTRVRKAVIAGETNGYGYGILSPIAQNAILDIRDMYLRPEAYAQAEEYLKVLLADLITAVQNGMDYMTALEQAYRKIYYELNPSVDLEGQLSVDSCYRNMPSVERAIFNRTRYLLLKAND